MASASWSACSTAKQSNQINGTFKRCTLLTQLQLHAQERNAKMKKTQKQNREGWLHQGVEMMRSWFNGSLPKQVQVSVGFPKYSKGNAIGQCWSNALAADKLHHIFITPKIDDPVEALAILAHELVHAAVGIKASHGPAFREVALSIGLEGRMKATVAGEELKKKLQQMTTTLGAYPHGALNPSSDRDKQGTRLVKVECECGCVVRMTRKWLDTVGEPTCGCGSRMHEA